MNGIDVYGGVDIGGSKTAVGIVDCDGKILQKKSFQTHPGRSADELVLQLAEVINDLCNHLDSTFSLAGIGIAAPAANCFRGTIESPANLDWGEFDVVTAMRRHFDLPIAVINDGNAAALGEMRFGAAREMKNFIVITLGTGLGSGIVINGGLLCGEEGLAGELGHIKIASADRQCGCGRVGCAETYVSATGVCRTALQLLAQRSDDSMLRHLKPIELTGELIHEYAIRDDPIAIAAFEMTGLVFGRMLADTVAIFGPKAIILMGGLAEAGELLLTPTRESFEQNLLSIYKGKINILTSALRRGHAAILGASALIAEQIKAQNDLVN